nr:YtxH domain-containing protein [Kineosphaera limosa]
MFIAGVAIGYVLGARDGRGRYEQIKSQADSLWHDPRVQEKVHTASATVKEKAPEVQAKLAEAAGQAKDAAMDKVSQHKDDSSSGSGTTYPPAPPPSN